MSEDAETPESQEEEQPQADRLVTLGELLEASHIRFVERVRERQKKGEIE